MQSIIRISCAVNRSPSANPSLCGESLLDTLEEILPVEPDLIVFPRLALAPPSSGVMLKNPLIASLCSDCLDVLQGASLETEACLFVGMIKEIGGLPMDVVAVIQRGKVLGFLPSEGRGLPTLGRGLPSEGLALQTEGQNRKACGQGQASFNQGGQEGLLAANTVFQCGELRFCVWVGEISALPFALPNLCKTGCSAVVVAAYAAVTAESRTRERRLVQALSEAYGIAIVVCCGGVGDTSSPLLFEGRAAIYECGLLLGSREGSLEAFTLSCDVDCDILAAERRLHSPCFPNITLSREDQKKGLLRTVSPFPFLPVWEEEYLDRLFDLQVKSLTARIVNTGLRCMVIGVSGGLDSTMALLVCHEALTRLQMEPSRLVAVTMPGFGTSDRTYYNALSLIEAMKATNRDIPIRASVRQHFEDIGHDPAVKNTTYENAQARERTQILLDISNSCRGLVVGTGDLSEAALGWCTFGGDQLAGYNVNICITKTMVRRLVTRQAQLIQGDLGKILLDIVETPVSPELLPPDDAGNIKQKTEDILGSYALHDFFLYYLIRYRFRPRKIFYYACLAFSSSLTPDVILEKLRLFIKRFFEGQFKRSTAPDAASLTDVNLQGYVLPSDSSPEDFLRELDSMEAPARGGGV